MFSAKPTVRESGVDFALAAKTRILQRQTRHRRLYTVAGAKRGNSRVGAHFGVAALSSVYCVMHFSNSIFDTDKKQSLLCDECYLQAAIAITNIRVTHMTEATETTAATAKT